MHISLTYYILAWDEFLTLRHNLPRQNPTGMLLQRNNNNKQYKGSFR